MLKQKKSKKLALRSETIRSLADHDLVAANGAHADTIKDCQMLTVSHYPFCPTTPINICLTKSFIC